MKVKVCKFGGSSLADANQIRKVAKIIKSDPDRRYIVVSAPGKRHGDDEKITDLLIRWHSNFYQDSGHAAYCAILERFEGIVRELNVGLNIKSELAEISETIKRGTNIDFVASRGEYLMARIMALFLSFDFIDAEECINLDRERRYDEQATRDMGSRDRIRKSSHAVIPGYYGKGPHGEVRTFSRGGSDISGAIVAQMVGASAYENWTDANGICCADPRIVANAKSIHYITYRELRELTYNGASVFHEEAVFPVKRAGVPINVRNTNSPEHLGTWIVPEDQKRSVSPGSIVGIAGRTGFNYVWLEKAMMNNEIGFIRRLSEVFEKNGVSIEHTPGSVDEISVIADASLGKKRAAVLKDIQLACNPDSIEIEDGLALICVVGSGMSHSVGVAARLFDALAEHKVNVRMINQGLSEISIIIGVDDADYEKATRAIYHAFIP